jgi:nicotinamide phosphoribosyltransferase
VVQGLKAADSVFGHTLNSKGFKVITGCGIIQGDGINLATLKEISAAVISEGYSPENVAYGMGGGLLQKVNRDTMSFATKLNFIRYADGRERPVMKCPKTDWKKMSFPGILAVKRANGGIPTVFPEACVAPEENLLEVVYDCGPVYAPQQSFDELRRRVREEWAKLPPSADVVSDELKKEIGRAMEATRAAQNQV